MRSGEDIIAFAKANPWPPGYPAALMRRFLTEFISGQKMIFDISGQNGRIAVAVMLDRVSNLANDACLEILGCRPDSNSAQVFLHFVETAKRHIPDGKAGFQVGLPDKFVLSKAELQQSGLTHYYDTFKMLRPSLQGVGGTQPLEIREAIPSDAEATYDILCKSFAMNPETSIPDKKIWLDGFLQTPGSQFYLYSKDGRTLAFAQVGIESDSKEMEIRTIGVLPSARKTGIGQILLQHCLREGARQNLKTCTLTVAVENESALGLYVRNGFNTIEKFACYRWPKEV